MGVAVDPEKGEIGLNWGDHSALAFDSGATGNMLPKREIEALPPELLRQDSAIHELATTPNETRFLSRIV